MMSGRPELRGTSSSERTLGKTELAAMRPTKPNGKRERKNRNGEVETSHVNVHALRTARQIAETAGGKVHIIRWGRIEVW